MDGTFYEWVFVMSKGDNVHLTEAQHDFYLDNYKDGFVVFRDVEINPSFVVQTYRQPSQYFKDKYPCRKCFTTGQHQVVTPEDGRKIITCEVCNGTGVNLTK